MARREVDKTATELRRSGYFDVRMLETLATNWGVKRQDATKKKGRTEGTTGTTAAQEAEDGCFEVYFCFFLGKFRASFGWGLSSFFGMCLDVSVGKKQLNLVNLPSVDLS